MRHRIGLIGCGNIAGAWVKAVGEHPDCDLAIAFDLDPEAARSRAEEAGARAVTRLDDLLASDVDVVVVGTPTTSHPELVARAAEAGKHVLCEKPMALDLDSCRGMIEACEGAGVKLAVGHTIRFFGTFRAVRRLVAEGAIGEPVSGSFDRLGRSVKRPVEEASRRTGHWRENPADSGGRVLESFVHELDCARSVCGRVAAVSADIAGDGPRGEWMSPRIICGLVRFESGALVTARTGSTVGLPARGHWLAGTEGGVRFDAWGGPVQLWRSGADEPEEVPPEDGDNPYLLELGGSAGRGARRGGGARELGAQRHGERRAGTRLLPQLRVGAAGRVRGRTSRPARGLPQHPLHRLTARTAPRPSASSSHWMPVKPAASSQRRCSERV